MDLRSLASSNKLLYILVASISVLIFLTIVLVLRNLGGGSSERIVLEFWGVFDEPRAYDRVIRKFEAEHPNIKVEYRNLSYADYEREVIDALAAGSGPDIWMIHNTWLPKHGDKLVPMPQKIPGRDQPLMTMKQFRDTFVDVAVQDLTAGGGIYSMPVYVDTLALYYNKDLLNSAGFSRPPRTWEEFNAYVETMTRFDARGNITQSGAAIGSSRNINRSTDILMALMLQSGVQMTNEDGTQATFTRSVDNLKVGETALQYYTDFTNPQKKTYCWNDNQHYSVDAFAEGRTAMMFNYAHYVDLLREKSPRLNFSVAPMPQLNPSAAATYANYWTPAVSANSRYPNEAWEFIAFLSARENALDYLTDTRRPSARRDIVDQQKEDVDLGVFAAQALAAQSWYQVDNVAIEGIFADMIDDVNLNRASIRDALQNAESRVQVLMQRRR